MVIPEIHTDLHSGHYCNQLRDTYPEKSIKIGNQDALHSCFLNRAELMLRWNFSKAGFSGIPQKKLRTFQHGAECQCRHILEKMLIAFVTGLEVVVGNPLTEMMDIVEANACRKPLK